MWVGGVGLVLLTVAIVLRGMGRPEAVRLGELLPPGSATGYNVLLVTLDTTRWDRLGCYGDEDAVTPTLDRLAEGGVLFQTALTSVPLTLPSHATILTGLHPPRHGARDNGIFKVGSEQTTLAEILRAHGYQTAAFVACFVLDARFGLDQGFDVYDFAVGEDGYRPRMVDFNERSADEVTDAATDWLERRRDETRPFFAWVHYFDPHLPYRSPLQDQPQFRDRPYEAEITFTDQQLGRLLDRMAVLGLRDRTLVVVVSDHGEALGEHGESTHGMFIYNCTVRVPLLFSCPGLLSGPHRIADRLVGTVDLRPTIEDLLGLESSAPTDGVSLLRDDADADRRLYVETEGPLHMVGWSPLYGLQTLRYKYVQAPEPEFYDLRKDPEETQNLFTERSGALRAMEAELEHLQEQWGGATDASARQMSEEELERLRSLGYVHSTGARSDEDRPDPKVMIELYNQGMQAEALYGQGEYEEAARLAEGVIAQCPRCTNAIRVLAFCYLRLDRPSDAIELLETSVDREPDIYVVRALAQALIVSKDFAAAEEALRLYEALDPTDGRVAILRGDCLDQQGRTEEAIAQYERARRLDEHRVGIQAAERIARVRGR